MDFYMSEFMKGIILKRTYYLKFSYNLTQKHFPNILDVIVRDFALKNVVLQVQIKTLLQHHTVTMCFCKQASVNCKCRNARSNTNIGQNVYFTAT